MITQLFTNRFEKIVISQPMPPFIRELRDKIRALEKTQTRRPLNPQPSSVRESPFAKSGFEDNHGRELKPKYPDALRYLRESLYKGHNGMAYYRDDDLIALDACDQPIPWKWKKDVLSQIFMPVIAARCFFNWKVVRLQQISTISLEDICAEGVQGVFDHPEKLREAFVNLWNSINARRGLSFDLDPFVWAYEFHMSDSFHWANPE